MTKPIADARERHAALDPARSFIVQAPAGAGKTGLLTQRFLRLLATTGEPEEILAITFTRKAATEMRNRILDALRDAEAGTAADDDHTRLTHALAAAALARSHERGWSLNDNPGRLQVRTIDSLCHGLARRLPLLSRSGGPAMAVDDAGELYRLAALRTLALVDDPEYGRPVAVLLSHLDNNPLRAQALLAAMLGQRDQWLRHLGGSDDEGLSRIDLEASMQRLVDETLDRIEEKLPLDLSEDLWASMAFARAHLPDDKGDQPLGRWDGIPPTVADGGDRLARWNALRHLLLTQKGELRSARGMNKSVGFPPAGKDADLQAAKDRVIALLDALRPQADFITLLGQVEGLPAPHYSDAQWALLERMPALLNLAYAQLRLIFAERGLTDHAEVNAAAGLALGTDEAPTDLALALDYRLQHILVDEFQDTSRTQFELLLRLTVGWQPGDGHSFFAVGDPMQSIYRFRQAEVGLFIEARERGLGDLPLESLVLQTNFRSSAQVIDWVNGGFSVLFPGQDDCDRGAIRYAPATAFQDPDAEGGVHVHPLFGHDTGKEAQLAVDLIHQALQAGHRSIAVLARSRTHLHAIAGELTRRDIAFQAVEVQRLGERLAVRELHALTRALVLPGDRAAWLAVLRAPWCGLDLADLTALAGDDAYAEVVQLLSDTRRLAGLSSEGATRAGHVLSVMRDAIAHRRRRGLRETVESAWLALGGPACLQSSSELAAARAFLDLVGRFEGAADLPLLQRLDEAMDRLYAPPDPEAPPTVQLMTIHKAKGLEFDSVILPGLGRTPRNDERELVQWLEFEGDDGRPHFVAAPIAGTETGSDPLEQLLRRTEKDKQALETVRLLYVAATRAKKSLHLIGAVAPADDPDALKPRRNSLLDPLWPVIAEHFREALARYAPAQTDDLTGHQQTVTPLIRSASLWSLPALADPVPFRDQQEDALIEPEYEWAGSSARHIGTLIHRYLERIARDGLEQWSAGRIQGLQAGIEGVLEALAVGSDEVEAAAARVIKGLCAALTDGRGRWILTDHAESRCEYALTALVNDRPLNLIIDRTFIDAEGVRWIIDYKTGSHEGGRTGEFLDREQERYRPQLERYAEVMRRLHPDPPIRLGLYFPLLGGWREWEAPEISD